MLYAFACKKAIRIRGESAHLAKDPSMSDALKKAAAYAAADAELKTGMKLGLGTGSTARFFVEAVAERMAHGERYLCVPTSEATRRQAEALGISLARLEDVAPLDLTVDGADELDPALTLIKGGGGALLREKIVAFHSKRMIVIADASKQVARLGGFALPVEVTPFTHALTARAIAQAFADLGVSLAPRLRLMPDGAPFYTDNANLIYDCPAGILPNARALAAALEKIPGLVDHGLFIGLCSAAYLADERGVAVLRANA